ncbi:MAG: hypothetical protein Q8R28_22195, partial [Dehalococcoidia bacterium]|nr:hypothetical protein [Dehalococcoidia bacterium]
DGLAFSPFEPYTTTRPYTLTTGDGLKAVWAQYKTVTDTVTGPYSDTIILDTVPPTSTVESLAAYQNVLSFPVDWSATDATSGPASYDLQYRDGITGTWTNWIAATAALSATFAGQDSHTYYLRARARDNAGNQGDYPVEAQAQTTVDTTPPVGSIAAPSYANSTAITLTLTATDTFGVASMTFGSDGLAWGSWEPYSTTRSLTLSSGEGQKTVYARFRDNAGNDSVPYSTTLTLDITPPFQPFPDDGVSGVSRNPTPTFTWAPVTDNLSGVAGYSWRVDSTPETFNTTTTLTLPTQEDGEHAFSVRAVDRAGNYGSYGAHLFTINTAAPSPPDILQPQTPTAADKIIVSGAAPPNSTVKLYVNGAYFAQATAGAYGIWNLVNVPIRMGENVLQATATDAPGLTSALSSPLVVVRVHVYHAPPADMASAVVNASAGATITTTNNYMVIVPQGAFTQTVKVVVTPLAPQSAPTVFGVTGTDSYAAFSAVTSDTGATVTSFQHPVTVTLSYDPAMLTVPASTLTIKYYDDILGRWVSLPSVVDTVNHTVSAQTDHFTVFGILADLPWRAYLPLVPQSHASGW